MFYRKNLPVWERGVRLGGAVLMGVCAAWYVGTAAGWAFGFLGLIAAATAMIGFCPMCAMAGRKRSVRRK